MEFNIIFWHSFLLNTLTFLHGFILLKNNISLAYILPIPDTNFYEELKITCQPVAINSGFVWPKKGSKNSHRTITVSILKPISSGLAKEEFIKDLENNIYKELDLLN